MNDPWYNNIVNEDFDGDYKNVMNHVEKQINYHVSKGVSTSRGAVMMGVPMMEMTRTSIMIVNDDDDDNTDDDRRQ